MPAQLTYPGVYVEEVSSGVRTIVGVATSIAAFLGRTERGSTESGVLITSYAQFADMFGGLWANSQLGFAVRDFYANGGSRAVIGRLYKRPADDDDGRARVTLDGDPPVAVVAVSPGTWGDTLRVSVDYAGLTPNGDAAGEVFNLNVRELGGRVERFVGVSLYSDHRRNARDVLAAESQLVRWDEQAAPLKAPPNPPAPRKGPAVGADKRSVAEAAVATAEKALVAAGRANPAGAGLTVDAATQLRDGAKQAADQADQAVEDAENAQPPDPAAITAAKDVQKTAAKKLEDAEAALTAAKAIAASDAEVTAKKATLAGLPAGGGSDGLDVTAADVQTLGDLLLHKVDLFNILCIPPFANSDSVDPTVYDWAAGVCEKRRAVLLVDAPSSWNNTTTAVTEFSGTVDTLGGRSSHSAVYFPRLRQPNPLKDGLIEEFAPCGAVAGVIARTDGTRGVWKAPAGMDAGLRGVPDLSVHLDDDSNGQLNPLGVNCLRSFPIAGRVVWGARTLAGADALASEWKYLPIRRLALYIEESLFRGTKWVVFEPNDEPLWAQIRLNVGSFMHGLFRQGAFQGGSPRDAYFVKCDKDTTTEADRNLGVVNIQVGFAPLKPAEFVVIRLQQMAGQIET